MGRSRTLSWLRMNMTIRVSRTQEQLGKDTIEVGLVGFSVGLAFYIHKRSR